MSWMRRAACRETSPELFFPAGETPSYQPRIAEALMVCYDCPVTSDCLQYAMEREVASARYGIWGGLTARDRDRYADTGVKPYRTVCKCSWCGKRFFARPRGPYATEYCSLTCIKLTPGVPEDSVRQCRICHQLFEVRSEHQRYCGKRCRSLAAGRAQRNKDRSKGEGEKRSCEYCGKTYVAATYHARFCSNPCKRRFYKQEREEKQSSICVMCGKPTRGTLKTCSPRCLSLSRDYRRKRYVA